MPRILVVDDDAVVRALMAEILERAGHDVVVADTFAADEVRADSGLDLVVSDIRMPGLSGFELIDELRRNGSTVPVLLVTGVGDERAHEEALARGAVGLLPKPFTHAELRDAVGSALAASG